MNKDAEAEIERLRGMIYLEGYDDNSWISGRSDALRDAMSWAFDYAAQHCDAQKVVWAGQQVDPSHVLDMTAKNLRALINLDPQTEFGLRKPK